MPAVLRSKLVQLYEQRLEDQARQDQFHRIVDEYLNKLPRAIKEETASDEAELDRLSWETWIGVFRAILHDLCDVLGLPGDFEMKVGAAKPAG